MIKFKDQLTISTTGVNWILRLKKPNIVEGLDSEGRRYAMLSSRQAMLS